MTTFRVVDLFSGIGGFSLGLESTGGFKTVLFCDNAPSCRHLLKHHWPEVPIHDDVCTLKAEDVGSVDVICGGFPCQDISFAGSGAGLAGARSGLWREFARLICEFRPRFVIVENVSALLGRGLGVVLGDLAALGYDAWWDCIPAAAVGAPHRRDRLWVVAYARGHQHEGFGDAFRRAIAAELSGAAEVDSSVSGRFDDEADAFDPDADLQRPHRAQIHQFGSPELRYEQDRLPGSMGQNVDNPDQFGHLRADDEIRPGRYPPFDAGWWLSEPDVGRVAHGIPARVDRLHGLGNAVVPQIPEIIGRAILAALESKSLDGSSLQSEQAA